MGGTSFLSCFSIRKNGWSLDFAVGEMAESHIHCFPEDARDSFGNESYRKKVDIEPHCEVG